MFLIGLAVTVVLAAVVVVLAYAIPLEPKAQPDLKNDRMDHQDVRIRGISDHLKTHRGLIDRYQSETLAAQKRIADLENRVNELERENAEVNKQFVELFANLERAVEQKNKREKKGKK